MLWRALQHVARGFYIDVGAAWPDHRSVTKLFYDQGWRGLNVEPNADLWKILCEQRGDDINLNLALSSKVGSDDVYVIPGTGLSTLTGDIAALHEASGYTASVMRVDVATLADIWPRYVGEHDVHFLKVDVEGHEREVILGNDWQRNRPWVVIVEATRPMSQVESFSEWEPILLEAAYHLAYADGLNRFYVASEHHELLPALALHPNVFDRFVPAAQDAAEAQTRTAKDALQSASRRLEQVQAELQSTRAERDVAGLQIQDLSAELDRTKARLRAAHAHVRQMKARLRAFKLTLSWRITKPFRWLRRTARRILGPRR